MDKNDILKVDDVVMWKYPMPDEANDIFKIISITESKVIIRLYIPALDEMLYEPIETIVDALKLS